jgi:predicted nucleotidyltransferase
MVGMGVDEVTQGQAVLAEAVSAYRQALGERLVAAYALGSLAHGGFSPLVSDVDLCVVLTDPFSPEGGVPRGGGRKRSGPDRRTSPTP